MYFCLFCFPRGPNATPFAVESDINVEAEATDENDTSCTGSVLFMKSEDGSGEPLYLLISS